MRRGLDAADSRASRIRITEAGRATFARLWPRMAEAHAGMFKGIPAAERHAFVGTLSKMLANVHAEDDRHKDDRHKGGA